MWTKWRLREEVIATLKEGACQKGNIAVYFAGMAHQFLGVKQEDRIARTILVPMLKRAEVCRAFGYGEAFIGPTFREVLSSIGKQQMVVQTDLPEDMLVKLLVGTRGKRPTLVWSVRVCDECLRKFLDAVFDPHILTNPRTVCGDAAIRYAHRSVRANPDKVHIVLPSNQCLASCLLYFHPLHGREVSSIILENINFSEHYIRMYCRQEGQIG